jgi:hypothetical protein
MLSSAQGVSDRRQSSTDYSQLFPFPLYLRQILKISSRVQRTSKKRDTTLVTIGTAERGTWKIGSTVKVVSNR